MDPIRTTKPPLPGITEQASISEDSSATTQEQTKIRAGITEAKDGFETKTDDSLFTVNATKGQVKFGDGIQGKVPETGDERRNSYFSGKTLRASDLAAEQESMRDKRRLEGTKPGEKPITSELGAAGGSVDPNALVQYVLRESYVQTTEDLKSYAEKVKYFNEMKKEVREYLEASRNSDAADKLNNLAPGKDENTMGEFSSVIRDSIQDSNDSKKYYLDLLQSMNKISSELSAPSQSISDATKRLSKKEKDDDDP